MLLKIFKQLSVAFETSCSPEFKKKKKKAGKWDLQIQDHPGL